MNRKFASIGHPEKYGYSYSTDSYDSKAPVCDYFRMFETYGDGLCQHSGDWGVTTENIADYFLSLAVAMLEDKELVEAVSYHFNHRPNQDQLEFAARVIFKAEGKTRFFSVEELGISANYEKRHDKRYAQIEPCHDGSPEAMFSILNQSYSSGIQRYCIASAIRDYLYAGTGTTKYFMEQPAEFLKWTNGPNVARRIRDGYEACWALVKAQEQRRQAECHIGNYQRSVEQKVQS